MKQTLPLTKIGFFNPGRLSDGEIEQLFTTRIAFFELLFNKITEEKPGSIPQHYLVIGQRGMGKTSLLMRIAAELRKEPYRYTFIPLTFPEEQYNVDRLSKFWLNCMDALADALDKEGKKELLPELDSEIQQLSKNRNTTAKEVLTAFQQWTEKINRRPVLLVDNLNLIFNTINKDEQHELRASLMSPGAPVLVGASVISIDETLDYAAPFYDAFQISYLNKLSFEESMNVLISLGKLTGNDSFETILRTRKSRVHALYMLTGGTPRTLAILFPLIQQGFSTEVQTDLDAILDTITPLYKARFEELAPQLQVIMDAVALHWDPATLEQIRETTQLDNPQLSPQLKRLVDVGWLSKIKWEKNNERASAYEVSERFFNIWYLMRRSSRRQKRELYCLTKFLEVFYGDDISAVAKERVDGKQTNENQVAFDLALADAVKDTELGERLRLKSYNSIFEMLKDDQGLLQRFSLPDKIKSEKIVALLNSSLSFFNENKIENAKNELELVLRINENDPYAWTLLAMLFTSYLGKYAEAEQAYMKAISNDDKFPKPWVGLGDLYQLHYGKFAESEQAYLKAISIDENDATIWKSLGNLYQNHLGKYNESEQAYLKAISIDENDATIWIGLGNLYQNHLGKYPESEKAYLKAISLDEKYATSWKGLGDLYKDHLVNYLEAEKAYLQAIRIDEKYAYAWYEMGNLYQINLGKYAEAEKAYLQAISLDEKFVFAWIGLGSLYQTHLNKYAESEKAYLKAVSSDEGSVYAWYSLGNIYHINLRRYSDSENAYLKAIDIDNKFVFAWISLGGLYKDYLGKYAESEKAYLKAISLEAKNATPWYGLGNLYKDYLAKYTEAEQAYLKAINLDEKFADPWNGLGNLYQYHLSNYAEAELAYMRAINLNDKFANPWYDLGNLYQIHMGKYPEAEQFYLKAISLDEKDPSPWNSIGNLYMDHFKQYDKAESAYRKATELDTEYFYAIYNLVFLLRDKKGEKKEAEKIFGTIQLTNEVRDCYWLHKSLFSIYDNNTGLAEKYLSDAIQCVENEQLPYNTKDDWYRSLAVMVRLGFSNSVLKVFKTYQWDIIMRPLYVAIEAMSAKNSELFLNSVAAEVREPAKIIMEWMKNYNKE